MKRYWWASLTLALLAACGGGGNLDEALESVKAEDLLSHIRVLSSDEFEGRAPASPGEAKTVEYLEQQFRRLNLAPGNPNGGYVQKVPLVGITSKLDARITAGGKAFSLKGGEDFVAISARAVPQVNVDSSQLIFVGYGIEAPEYKWNDFKGVNMRGKTLVFLVNDPPVEKNGELDDSYFKGRAMTYYGRWTYKYEKASELGADAAIIIHETGPAGYPFEVLVGSSWNRENFDISRTDKNMGRVPVEAWISEEKARELFQRTGQDFDELKRRARTREFQPVPLNAQASFTVQNSVREVESSNVVAKLPGASKPEEYVVYTAHWDHLGIDPGRTGDRIYNGAIDNAGGVAMMLEIAEAFTQLEKPPQRSILFLAVTAEEKGLLGAKYYAANPLYPLEKTVANINMDGINQWGRTKDLVVVGLGNSTLDDIAQSVAARQGRTLKPDAEPEKGFFYRSDHFELAKRGVPALYTDAGTEFIGKPEGYGMEKRELYTAEDYHKVTDEVKPGWDLSGAVEDTKLLFQVGLEVAKATVWPEWKAGTEFKAKREESLR